MLTFLRMQISFAFFVSRTGSLGRLAARGVPLKTQPETVWVLQVHLLHAVVRDLRRLLDRDAFGQQFCVSAIYVRCSEEEAGIAMWPRAHVFFVRRTLVIELIYVVQHQVRRAEPHHAPVKLIF